MTPADQMSIFKPYLQPGQSGTYNYIIIQTIDQRKQIHSDNLSHVCDFLNLVNALKQNTNETKKVH